MPLSVSTKVTSTVLRCLALLMELVYAVEAEKETCMIWIRVILSLSQCLVLVSQLGQEGLLNLRQFTFKLTFALAEKVNWGTSANDRIVR